MTARWQGEDGVAATQLAVVMPAVLLLIMLTVQFGLWAHASQLANAAADAAATAAALPDGTDEAGRDAATQLLRQAGNLTATTVDVDRGSELVSVVVTGTAPQVAPGFRWSVTAHAAAPIERFVPQGQR